jgi:NADP-dependent 3-hydroxy acid dehydrogenase YdfG
MGKLEGTIALIIGGKSGIGLATAKQFVNEGTYVFITGQRETELAWAVKEIGRNVTAIQGDVSNLKDLVVRVLDYTTNKIGGNDNEYAGGTQNSRAS